MIDISIPYHLLIPAIFSILCFVLILIGYKRAFKTTRKRIWISISTFLIIYALIVGSAALTDIKYQKDLNKFDLNNDGFFSENEKTNDQEKAMFRLTNDVGRNFSIFSGAIFSGLLALVMYVVIWGLYKYKKLKQREITTHNKS
jgi:phosphoglycerol transferase MdoB-like AlkP superfamily enzyme